MSISDALRAIAEPRRRRILMLIWEQEMSAGEIEKKIAQHEAQLEKLNRRRDRAQINFLNDEIDHLEAKLSQDDTPDAIKATVGFEMWYFGVLLYQLCTQDGETLWKCNQADDIGREEMRILAHQWDSVKASKLAMVVWDDARDLIGWLLSEDVADRPQAWQDVLDSPFLCMPYEEGVPPGAWNYLGMTAAEDWRRVKEATTVHIISTPWDKKNPIAGRKAVATKDGLDNQVEGIYVFNPNTGLRAAAEAEQMTEEQQGAEWLRLWSEVLERVRDTGGNCYVMAKSTAPGPYKLEGGGQKGEVQVAKLSLDPENTGHKGPSGHWESARIIYVKY